MLQLTAPAEGRTALVTQGLTRRARAVALGGAVIASATVVAILARFLSLGMWPTDFGLGLQRAVLACLFGSGALVMCVQVLATRGSRPLPILAMSTAGFILSVSGLFISLAVESNPRVRLGEATQTGLWLDLDVAMVMIAGVVAVAAHRPRQLAAPRAAVVATAVTGVMVAAALFGTSWAIAWSPYLGLVEPPSSLTRVWTVLCVAIGAGGLVAATAVTLLLRARGVARPTSMVVAAALTGFACLSLAGARSIPGTGWHLGHGLLIAAAGAYFLGQLRILGGAMRRERLRIRELTMLQAAARDLAETLDLPTIRHRVVAHAAEILSVHDRRPWRAQLVRVRNGRLAVIAQTGPGAAGRAQQILAVDEHPALREAIRTQSTRVVAPNPFVAEGWAAGVAPIVVDGEVGGLLAVSHQGGEPPLPGQLEALTGLANIAGIAFTTAWALRDETVMVSRLRTLAARSAEIAAARGLDEALLRVLRAACELTASRGAEIAVLSEDGLHLDRQVAWASGEPAPPRLLFDPPVMAADPLPVPQPTPYRLADLPAGGETLEALCRGAGILSLAGVPLLYQDTTLGTLYVTGKREELEPEYVLAEYESGDLVLLSALAVDAAVAIDNARLVRRLEESALLDPLTRLPNRRAYDRFCEEQPDGLYCVLAIDVDNLKVINDEAGHECGDAVLRTVGDSLRASVRAGDFVARIGGDEFVVVVQDGSVATADALSRRIQRFLYGSPVPHGQARLSVGAARGAAHMPVAGTWAAADAMLVRAKAAGGDCMVWQPEGGSASSPTSWDDRITAALAPGGLRAVFQPVVRLNDGCIVGLEALARPSGDGAQASVEGLFAAAQRLGRMRDLDWACRRQAIEAAGRLPRGVPLFLNVSAGALCDPMHPVDQMELLLDWASLRPRDVVLEITERERISDGPRLQETVARYRDAGFRFALDDLGEGQGSMATLVSIAPEFQKLAKGMLARDDPAVAGLLAAVAGFSKETGGLVIAEGVEDAETIPWLVEHGVDLGQGFGICKPMEAAQVADLVRRGRIDLGLPESRPRRRSASWDAWGGQATAELAWPPHVARRRRRTAV